jgi:hypothetical protein
MWGGIAVPAITIILFSAIGVGVFAQPGIEYWGAGILLLAVAFSWWVYIQFFAVPRLVKVRAESVLKRKSRRPKAET